MINEGYGTQENDTRQVSRGEEASQSLPNRGGETGSSETSGSLQGVSLGATGDDGPRPVSDRAIIGGILSQLLAEAREKLADSEECLIWYEREKQKAQARIEQIEALLSSHQQQS